MSAKGQVVAVTNERVHEWVLAGKPCAFCGSAPRISTAFLHCSSCLGEGHFGHARGDLCEHEWAWRLNQTLRDILNRDGSYRANSD